MWIDHFPARVFLYFPKKESRVSGDKGESETSYKSPSSSLHRKVNFLISCKTKSNETSREKFRMVRPVIFPNSDLPKSISRPLRWKTKCPNSRFVYVIFRVGCVFSYCRVRNPGPGRASSRLLARQYEKTQLLTRIMSFGLGNWDPNCHQMAQYGLIFFLKRWISIIFRRASFCIFPTNRI